jgi:hypothetical protein
VLLGQQGELAGQRRGHGLWHLDARHRHIRPPIRVSIGQRRARELLDVERVPRALRVDRGGGLRGHGRAEQLTRLVLTQAGQLDPLEPAAALRSGERAGQRIRHLAGAERHGQQHGRGGRPAKQRPEQLGRRRIGPVHVVEQKHERLGRRELLEEQPHPAVHAVALVAPRPLRSVRERGEHRRYVGEQVVVQRAPAPWLQGFEVLVERIDEDPERQLALQLGRASGQHQTPLGVRTRGQLAQQPRLADARLSDQFESAEAPALEVGEGAVDHT